MRQQIAVLILLLTALAAHSEGPTFVGASSSRIAPNLATTYPYSDDPILSRSTIIRRAHLLELRVAVDAVRQQASLSAFSWTDAQPTRLRAVHLTELRTALEQSFIQLRRPLPVWSGPILPGGTVNASHFQEIRNATRWEASGAVTSNTTWTSSGSPYVVQGNVSVANGATLTIAAGTIVKFMSGTGLYVSAGATLVANGTPANPIYFTSYLDDTVGGDTNRDGAASAPQNSNWGSIDFGTDGGRAYGSITNVIVRYATALNVRSSAPALTAVTLTRMFHGLFLKAPPGDYTISGLKLIDNNSNLVMENVSSRTTIRDSTIRGATFGAVFAENGTAARLINNSIDHNRGEYAIWVDGSSPLYLRENSITRNRSANGVARAIQTSCCQTIDARDNWWGSTTGPEVLGDNNSGGGGQVGSHVSFDPWLGKAWAGSFKMGDHPWTVKAGVSVDVTSGNFYLQELDLSITTVGFPLEIVRTYNNKIAGGTLTDFGVGWTWNYGTQLEVNVDSHGVIWYREDGIRAYFKRNVDGTFSGEDGIYERLVSESGVYRLTRKDQSVLIFDLNGRLGTLQDRSHNTTLIVRNAAGRIARVEDATGRTVVFDYVGSRIWRITDPLNRTIEYDYHANGAIRQVLKRDQHGSIFATTTYSYGSGGAWEMTNVDDADGNHLEMSYDIAQRVKEQKLNGNSDIDLGYGPTSMRGISIGEWETIVFDSRGRAHLYPFTMSNKVTEHLRQVMTGGGWTWSTDERWTYTGYLVDSCREFGGTDGTTTATYDWNAGNLTGLVEPGGRTTTHTYDAFNNLTRTTDANGYTTTFEYDNFHRLVKTTDPLGRSTRHEYGSRGLLVSSIDALGRTSSFTYDQWGYPQTIVNPMGETTSCVYDIAGRKLSETTPQTGQTTYTYDGRGNVLTTTDALFKSTVNSYDQYGRKTGVTDALGRATSYVYDNERNALWKTIDARGGEVWLTRDRDGGNITSVRDANNHTTYFVYDDLNRKIEEIDPLGRSWHFAYIGRDRLSSVTDANGQRTNYFYNANLEVETIAYADNRYVSYVYDAVGNKTQMSDWTGVTQWVHDGLNRVIYVAKNGAGTTYLYDEVGNLSHRIVENGKPVAYTYDAANRLKTVTDWQARQTTYSYVNGRMASYTLPNGVTSTFDYDAVGRPTAIYHKRGGTTFERADYGYDAVGNRLWRRHNDGMFESYGYDELYRLTYASYPTANLQEQYNYDAGGNRIHKATSGGGGPWWNRYFSYDVADQLLNDETGNQCSYDANGSLSNCGSQSFSWDAQGRLSYAYSGGVGTSYSYDGDGRRVGLYRASTFREFLVDTVASPHEVLKETTQDNTSYFVYGHDLLYVIDNRGPHYHHTDAIGSVVKMTRADGGDEASNIFNVFGVSLGSGWTHERTRRRFTGEEDDDNGLMYLRARYYEPYIGRFLSRDPFPIDEADTQGINRYVYVQNNPVNNVDPTGEYLESALDIAAIGYDLYDIARTSSRGGRPTAAQFGALGADLLSLAAPGFTGGGMILRSADAADAARRGARLTTPSLPNKTIARRGDVRIQHHYPNDHPPAHLHVKGGGRQTRIGPNGYPTGNNPAMTARQRAAYDVNKAAVRRALNKIGRYLKSRRY